MPLERLVVLDGIPLRVCSCSPLRLVASRHRRVGSGYRARFRAVHVDITPCVPCVHHYLCPGGSILRDRPDPLHLLGYCVHMAGMDMATREHDHDFHMRLSAAVLAALDKIRRKEKDMPSRAEVIRRLILERAHAR